MKKEIKSAQSLILHEELKQRRKVLRQLGFVDNGGVVALKVRRGWLVQPHLHLRVYPPAPWRPHRAHAPVHLGICAS